MSSGRPTRKTYKVKLPAFSICFFGRNKNESSKRRCLLKWNLIGGVGVITGAASGIGRALAERLAHEKMSLALVDVDFAGLEQTAHLINSPQNDVSIHLADVADANAVERLSVDVLQRHKRVSLLINNAGVGLLGSFEELTLEEFDWLMRINFWGVVHGVKFFLPLLRREPRAHIVNVSAVLGILASAGSSAYCASKFAVRGLTEVLQDELDGTTVGVTCALPGRVRSHIARHSRVSANTSELIIDEPVGFTSAEAAANRIVNGVTRGEQRILVGPDALFFDRLQRLFPTRYSRVLKSLRKLRKKLLNPSAVRQSLTS